MINRHTALITLHMINRHTTRIIHLINHHIILIHIQALCDQSPQDYQNDFILISDEETTLEPFTLSVDT